MRFRIKQQVLILLAAAALIVGFVVLRYLPMHRKSQTLESEQRSQQALIQRAQTAEAQIPKLREQLDELNLSLADFENKIPADTQLGQFLGRVAALMDQYRLTEQQITPKDQIKTGRLVCTPVTMKCRGRLEQIRMFCESLQSLDRAVRIEKFNIINDSDYSGSARMEIEAVIYHRSNEFAMNEQGGQDNKN
ncbi:MAG: type 4a pilus biogenesis protein PilO [Phycisphaerae bacterium]|jgi:type IV pilus assembly protein PilO